MAFSVGFCEKSRTQISPESPGQRLGIFSCVRTERANVFCINTPILLPGIDNWKKGKYTIHYILRKARSEEKRTMVYKWNVTLPKLSGDKPRRAYIWLPED